jgi:hypothetical protein
MAFLSEAMMMMMEVQRNHDESKIARLRNEDVAVRRRSTSDGSRTD